MTNWLVIVGLIICAILVLIPIAMVGRLIYRIISGYRDHRRAEARKITKIIPDLGEFSTTDDRLWFGEVRGLQVTLDSPEQPPTESQAKQVLALLDKLPALTETAKSYLVQHEDISWLDGERTFEPFGIEPVAPNAFVLELTHPSDVDGVYRVEFDNGVPVSSSRDD